MKSSKIEFIGNGDPLHKGEVHFTGTINDYTLCGLTLDNDPMTTGSFKETKKKVNCDYCKGIVDYCKGIRKTW